MIKRSTSRKNHFPFLSANIVKFLRDKKDMKLHEIGALAGGLSESFVSRVANRKSNFTCEHLERIEKNLGRPIALLLLDSIPRESLTKEERELYDRFLELFQKLDNLSGKT